jgi:large subunit ribosomal protein L17
MNQADVTKLMSRLRIKYKPVKRRLKNIEGPEGRVKKIQKTLTALFKHERIELNFNRADETRGYVERVSTCRIMLVGPVFCQFLYIHNTHSR